MSGKNLESACKAYAAKTLRDNERLAAEILATPAGEARAAKVAEFVRQTKYLQSVGFSK